MDDIGGDDGDIAAEVGGDISSYSTELKSVTGISQLALNYLSVASDLGKAFGWCSGVSLCRLWRIPLRLLRTRKTRTLSPVTPRELYEECARDVADYTNDPGKFCRYYKEGMDISCGRQKNTKDVDVSPSNQVENPRPEVSNDSKGLDQEKTQQTSANSSSSQAQKKKQLLDRIQNLKTAKEHARASIAPTKEPNSKSRKLGSDAFVRDGGIVDGLETFNDFTKKKTRPDECDIIRQQCEECVSKCGDDASCGSKKTTRSADASPSIFDYLCLIP